MDICIAWRNLWRNPRRTVVILSAVTVAMWTLLMLTAFTRGFMQEMIDNSIENMTGHLQIHAPGYLNDPGIEHSMSIDENVTVMLDSKLPVGSHSSARVRVDAIASNSRHSFGITLIGAEWEQEKKVSFIGSAMLEGVILQPDDENGVVIGKALFERFDTKIGHKLILMAQDSSGEIASRAFRIRGVYDAELESTEKQFVFVNLHAAQYFLVLSHQLSEYSILLPDPNTTEIVREELKQWLSDDYEVHDWLELLPAIRAYIVMWDQMYYIWVFIIFIAMGFGLINTMLMAVYERIREFGLVRALGMRRRRIMKTVLYESVFVLLIGLFLGNFLGMITVWFFSVNGIDLTSFAASSEYLGISRQIFPVLTDSDLLKSNLLVMILGILVSFYPAVQAARFSPIEAIHHVG